jgi:hypothetical protein
MKNETAEDAKYAEGMGGTKATTGTKTARAKIPVRSARAHFRITCISIPHPTFEHSPRDHRLAGVTVLSSEAMTGMESFPATDRSPSFAVWGS